MPGRGLHEGVGVGALGEKAKGRGTVVKNGRSRSTYRTIECKCKQVEAEGSRSIRAQRTHGQDGGQMAR